MAGSLWLKGHLFLPNINPYTFSYNQSHFLPNINSITQQKNVSGIRKLQLGYFNIELSRIRLKITHSQFQTEFCYLLAFLSTLSAIYPTRSQAVVFGLVCSKSCLIWSTVTHCFFMKTHASPSMFPEYFSKNFYRVSHIYTLIILMSETYW